MNSVDIAQEFPELQQKLLEIATDLQKLILSIFPDAEVTYDKENLGFGFGSGYKNLVFVISPQRQHINLGIANGASLEDPEGLMQGKGKVHRHVKLLRLEQVHDPHLEKLMRRALQVATDRVQNKP